MDTKRSKYNHLTTHDRDLIALLLGKGVSIRDIARKLGRSPSTISEEVKRNSFKGRYYVAINAQAKAEKRVLSARQRHPLKSPQIYSYVILKLRSGWSPEVIAGRLAKKYGKEVVCPETIYSFAYSDHKAAKRLALWQYLPRAHKKRRKKGGRKVNKSQIPGRISIHKRPAQVDGRKKIGHWEADTMEGKRIDNDGVHVDLERLTRKIFGTKLM